MPTGTDSRVGAPGRGKANASSQRRRAELIDVSCRLFAERGYASCSIQDIADAFGVLKGSLFHYVKSKDDLLFEVYLSARELGDQLVWSVLDEPGTAAERLRRLIVAYVRFTVDHHQWVKVLLNETHLLSAERRAIAEEGVTDAHDRMVALIAEAREQGVVPEGIDPSVSAYLLMGAMNWIHKWQEGSNASAEEIAEQLILLCLAPEPRPTNV